MPNREKVIKGLSELEGFLFKRYGEVSSDETHIWYDRFLAVSDALAMLKEQEAVKPTWGRGKPFCGACGLKIRGGKFCSECGKPIAWEGR